MKPFFLYNLLKKMRVNKKTQQKTKIITLSKEESVISSRVIFIRSSKEKRFTTIKETIITTEEISTINVESKTNLNESNIENGSFYFNDKKNDTGDTLYVEQKKVALWKIIPWYKIFKTLYAILKGLSTLSFLSYQLLQLWLP